MLFSGVRAGAGAADLDTGNRFGFQRIDHLTSNFPDAWKPALLWMEHVMGFEQVYGRSRFHTNDVAAATDGTHGSGLKLGGDVGIRSRA